MSANVTTAAPTGRKKLAQGKDAAPAADAALGNPPPNTSSPEGAKEGGELPVGWKWKTIPDLVGEHGVFIDGDWVESKDQDPNGNVRLIQLADVGDGVYRDKSDRFMTKAKADALRCTFLKDGDVLIARMPDPLGRACLFPGYTKPSVTVVDVAIVRSGNGEFDHRWLACFVNAHPFRSAISGLQAGSTRKRISRGNLAIIPLPVPPLPEQRRIVAEIEKQFTRLEAGVAALRRVQANLKRYRAAVLKAACEGKLVPTEAELQKSKGRSQKGFESGAELLNRILAERRKNWTGRGKYKEPAAPNTANLPPLPEGWTWATLEAITEALGGFAFESKKFSDSGYQVVKMANIKMGRLDLSQRPSFISDVSTDIAEKYLLQPRDILVTLTGTRKERDYGYVVEVKHQQKLLLNQRIARLRPSQHIVSSYLQIALQSESYRNRFFAYETGNVGQGNVGMRAVTVEPIALPPLAEQTRIVAEVERRLSVVEELESVVSANLQRATRLRQSILQKAFTGELTPA